MNREKLLEKIQDNLDLVIKKENTVGDALWKELIDLHPADISDFLDDLDRPRAIALFLTFPKELKFDVFAEFSIPEQAEILKLLPEGEKFPVLGSLGADELADLFEYMPDEDVKKHLKLLHKQEREKVISLLKFDPESAGGIMEVDVLSLLHDFTVEKSIMILRKLQPKKEIYREIYLTDSKNKLVGHIHLQDLLLHPSASRLSTFMHKNELVAQANEDREVVAGKMVHYGFMTVPVVGKDDYFLGVIPSDTLVDVIVEEATEDAQKMAALTPMKHTYFETPFLKILYQRGNILVILLLAQSVSTSILDAYSATLPISIVVFITMLMSTGGNTSHQTSTLVLQGMACGEIHKGNTIKFIKREMITASALALILGIAAFARVWFTNYQFWPSFAVSLTLSIIVMAAVTLGSLIPIGLKKMNIDPAFSAGPFLATLMDIVGVAIFCIVAKMIIS